MPEAAALAGQSDQPSFKMLSAAAFGKHRSVRLISYSAPIVGDGL